MNKPPLGNIVRYRCLACGVPHWVVVEEVLEVINAVINDPSKNTIYTLCNPCEERFKIEGPFWRKK